MRVVGNVCCTLSTKHVKFAACWKARYTNSLMSSASAQSFQYSDNNIVDTVETLETVHNESQ
jgi:hypothetical protein